MKKCFAVILMMLVMMLTACSGNASSDNASTETRATDTSEESTSGDVKEEFQANENQDTEDIMQSDSSKASEETNESGETHETAVLHMTIVDTPVEVSWEDNESVDALKELAAGEPLTIQMSMYGGFEQVGSLGTSLPRDDVQTTTSAGDIVLYSGDQIVVFYGSNSWAYTRLGKITDKTSDELAELLGNGDVEITISAQNE